MEMSDAEEVVRERAMNLVSLSELEVLLGHMDMMRARMQHLAAKVLELERAPNRRMQTLVAALATIERNAKSACEGAARVHAECLAQMHEAGGPGCLCHFYALRDIYRMVETEDLR